jgi:hypothetical protein
MKKIIFMIKMGLNLMDVISISTRWKKPLFILRWSKSIGTLCLSLSDEKNDFSD